MAYAHIYVIPDTAAAKGGDLYDKFGNLSYFADVTGLTDKTQTGYDITSSVSSFSRNHFMRDPAPTSVSGYPRFVSLGIRQSKGAIPGFTITLMSDVGTPTEEKREFQYTGTMSGFVAWIKTTANMTIQLVGPSGTPYDPIPAATS